MFDKIRPAVIVVNLTTLAWFIALQYYRFKPTGKACCGDYLEEIPDNYSNVYIGTEGKWLKYYIISQYVVYIF